MDISFIRSSISAFIEIANQHIVVLGVSFSFVDILVYLLFATIIGLFVGGMLK